MPFAQTALMHDEEENILHFTSHRIRVMGSGILKSTFFSMTSISSQVLANLTMSSPNNREISVLANFKSQRGMIKFYTDQLDDYFNITRITVFAKPLWTSKPQ